jgi:hypothetical protein
MAQCRTALLSGINGALMALAVCCGVLRGCPQLCHRCLTPQDSPLHFCSHCGAIVGIYTCLIPPLYLYPIGDVFRAGVEGTYRPSSFLTVGYFFAAISYAYWVPFPIGLLILFVYWIKLLNHIPKNRTFLSEGT